MIMSSRYICPPIAVRGEINAARQSNGNRTVLGRLFIIERYLPRTEAFRSPNDFEMNVFIKIVRAPSDFWRHHPVTGQGPGDELTGCPMVQ